MSMNQNISLTQSFEKYPDLPLSSLSSMKLQQQHSKLFQLVFSLADKDNHLQQLKPLRITVVNIIKQLKRLKLEGKLNEITSICNQNDKLKQLSKVLRQDYYKYLPELKDNLQPEFIQKPIETIRSEENIMSYQRKDNSPMLGPDSKLDSKNSCQYPSSRTVYSTVAPGCEYYELRIDTIKLFCHMLINDKMLAFINKLHVPFSIYIIILGEEQSQFLKERRLKERPYIVKRKVEKCLKFIYTFVKISKSQVPKIYCYLIKNLLLEFYPCSQELRAFFSHSKIKRINLCLDLIFQSALLILARNLSLAAQCQILTTLYHKCLLGVLPIPKVEQITKLIIQYCIEEKQRRIIHHHIDLDKTFAIFTNVDKAEETQDRRQKVDPVVRRSLTLVKNKDSLVSCSTMIEMYLTHWSTLLFFLQEQATISNFIISLKRKDAKQLEIVEQIIFMPVIKRCQSYNRKKLMKYNNIFSIESNYLIIRSLTLLHHLDRLPEFRQLVYQENKMSKFRESFLDIMVDYFVIREDEVKGHDANRPLMGNVKAMSYHKSPVNRQQDPTNNVINNNIQSFCSDSLLPFEFSYKELRQYLTTFQSMCQDQQLILKSSTIRGEFMEKEKLQGKGDIRTQNKLEGSIEDIIVNRKHEKMKDLLTFYQIAQQSCKAIYWKAQHLNISKYLSNTIGQLLQISQGKQKLDIMAMIRLQLLATFRNASDDYFHYLNVNVLDDIGRYFSSDPELINQITPNISNPQYAYKISRILMHVDNSFTTNFSTDMHEHIYSSICRNGSKPLILQVIEIIKYSYEQNDNIFRNDHLKNIFMLINSEDEDIVYSVIEFSEEYINKTKELEKFISKIDLKNIKCWNQRVHYLFLYYQSTIKKIEEINPTLLKEELEHWLDKSQKDRKKDYYSFLSKELKKFASDSVESGEYLNLNFDPNNYRKLIFLPWNVKINHRYHPVFIEYKNLEDKLKLKIFMKPGPFTQINIQQLYIGAHNYTDKIKPRNTLDETQNNLRLTIEEVRKEHNKSMSKTKRIRITKGDLIYFISVANNQYSVERININIPLTLDTYRPPLHPFNFINLLCRTSYGFGFLQKEKYIEHCMNIIKQEEATDKYIDKLKGALVSLGTLCGSFYMKLHEKEEIHTLIAQKYMKTTNHDIQQISLWILNILVKDPSLRKKINNLYTIESKKCGWICLPKVQLLAHPHYPRSQRIQAKIARLRKELPEAPLALDKCQTIDQQIYRYFVDMLHNKETDFLPQIMAEVQWVLQKGEISRQTVERLIRYISTIDFKLEHIREVMTKLNPYIALTFDQQFTSNKNDTDNNFVLP